MLKRFLIFVSLVAFSVIELSAVITVRQDTTFLFDTIYVADTIAFQDPIVLDSAVVSSPDTIVVEWKNDSILYLHFPLMADMTRRWCSNYSVTATPEVCDTIGNSVSLSSTIFGGKKNQRFRKRLADLGIIDTLITSYNLTDTIVYDTLVVVPDTMRVNCPMVSVKRLEEGCARINQMADDTLATFVCQHLVKMDTIITIDTIIVEVPVDRPAELVPLSITEYVPVDPTQVMSDDSTAILIHYDYDNAVVNRNFRDNTLRIAIIERTINKLLADTTRRMVKIRIIGSSSVEGSESYNDNLAYRRAVALAKYIQDNFDLKGVEFETVSIGEGWADFRAAIEKTSLDDLPSRQALLDIIDSTPNLWQRENKLKYYGQGKPWQYIMKEIIPYQRNAGSLSIFYADEEVTTTTLVPAE